MLKKSKFIAYCALLACSGAAFGHEGHGLAGGHWHASDSGGFVALAVAVAAAAWLSRK
ncbi:MAG: hypothetical protein PHI55_02845 [Burkholderiaceae bacterium]|nr:hypothetical protein [Burkholderiaceae bacterium]